MNQLRPVGLDFLDAARCRWDFQAEVAAPAAVVFAAISADPSTWTWFPGLSSGSYEGPGPHGAGSRRAVSMEGTVYRETILAWEAPHRWAYRVDESSAGLFEALAEDWVIEDQGDHSVVHWRFAADPAPEIADGLDSAASIVGGVFEGAMAQLSQHLSAPPA